MAEPKRKAQHGLYFNTFELDAMGDVCVRLDLKLEELSKKEVEHLLSLFYTLPHQYRGDKQIVLMTLRLALQMLTTFCRHELREHLSDPDFCAEALRVLKGDPAATHIDDVKGIQGVIDAIAQTIRGGAK